jgi:hypothetical protein
MLVMNNVIAGQNKIIDAIKLILTELGKMNESLNRDIFIKEELKNV